MKSIFSQRYNASKIRLNEAFEDVFETCRWAPRIANIPKTPEENFDTNAMSMKRGKLKLLKRNYETGDENDISITTRWEAEQYSNCPIMKRYERTEAEGTFSHTIWECYREYGKPSTRFTKVSTDSNPDVVIDACMQYEAMDVDEDEEEEDDEDQPAHQQSMRAGHIGRSGLSAQLVCDVCDKEFKNSAYLVKHKRLHTGEKPYACPIESCRRTFADRSNLRAHQRNKRHHNWEYHCFHCGKAFSKPEHMERHSVDTCRKYLFTHLYVGRRKKRI